MKTLNPLVGQEKNIVEQKAWNSSRERGKEKECVFRSHRRYAGEKIVLARGKRTAPGRGAQLDKTVIEFLSRASWAIGRQNFFRCFLCTAPRAATILLTRSRVCLHLRHAVNYARDASGMHRCSTNEANRVTIPKSNHLRCSRENCMLPFVPWLNS